MRIGHCQLESISGDFDRNLAKVVAGLERAERERIEIVSFPECFLSGYPDHESLARREAFAVDSPRMASLLAATRGFEPLAIVGFTESRGPDLYNTAAVIHRGTLLGCYSKCSAYKPFHKQGREFPVFTHKGVTFGVLICSDGGFIEPARLLALKGAKVIIAPHFNYLGKEHLISHFMEVRADHTARAIENFVYFIRGNNVSLGRDPGIPGTDGVGYGDSYIIDPHGEIVVRSRRHVEDLIFADLDLAITDQGWNVGRSRWSAREFAHLLVEATK